MPTNERAPPHFAATRTGERPTMVEDELTGFSEAGDLPSFVGRFRVSRKLGEGGMGVVYEAWDTELDRTVAIKLLHTKSLAGSRGRPRLLREAKTMARLSHPNVITIYDVGEIDDQVFIAMEYVEGSTLKQWLAKEVRTWRRILHVFVEAGQGLAAAHASGVIHRDFKPENVLVGRDGRVRVVDFGLARSMDAPPPKVPEGEPLELTASPSMDRLTVTGAVMGTPAYMAPEQFLGTGSDHRTDQFSFCVALWEALLGERPYQAGSFHELAMRVTRGILSPAPEGSSVPDWLLEILRRGLAAEPTERYPDMPTLLEVLARLQRGAEPQPPSPTTPVADDGEVAQLIGRRYRVLGSAPVPGRSSHRAVDRLTNRPVAVEFASLGGDLDLDGQQSAARIQFVTSLQKLTQLKHPHVVGILDYGFVDGQPYFVTDLHEGALSLTEATRGQPLSIKLNLIAQLLQGIAYLHRRGIRGLGLTASTVGAVDGKVKIFDLGAAVVRRARTDGGVELAFSAPEALLGNEVDEASDLYAAGMIACTVLLGRHPFEGTSERSLVDRKLTGEVSLADTELRPELAAVLERAMRRDPKARFRSAGEVIRALADAAGLPLMAETVETRESFLRAARFVGREHEMDTLDAALRRASEGQGSVWLVAGESGVGKSRLIEELRMLALASEVVVLRGQARSDSTVPYDSWRESMRWLVLMGEPDSVDAAVFAPFVPNAAAMIGHSIRSAPELDAKNSRARLHAAVEATFRRSRKPVLVLLDDLQWGRSESLELLNHLADAVESMPVMIVGTYRDDEAPRLAERIPNARTMHLRRLSREAIGDLSRSMIGPAGGHPELLELLARETEGNAFFLVEVVRALAEEAGDLEAIAGMELPRKVVSGGVRKVVLRRLERVEPWARPLLELAAVAGRQLDPVLLRRVADEVDFDRFVVHCADAAVLEVGGQQIRFAHDKLREFLLDQVGEARGRELHARIARAVEAAIGDSNDVDAAKLAHHYGHAGLELEEGRYSAIAAEHAFRAGSYHEAIALFERALEVKDRCGFASPDLVRWRRMLGESHYVLGDLSAALRDLGRALDEAGFALPPGRTRLWLLILRLVLGQMVFLLWPGKVAAADPARRRAMAEASLAAGRIANLCTYSGDRVRVLAGSLRAANLAERAGTTNPYGFAVMGYSGAYMGLHRLAERYFERARTAAVEQRDPQGLVEAIQMEAVYLLGEGEFGRCEALMRQASAAAEEARHRLGVALCDGFMAQSEFLRGDFQRMLTLAERAIQRLGFPAPEHEHSLLCTQALAFTMLGRFEEARRVLEERVDRVGADYLLGHAFVGSTSALVRTWEGHLPEALQAADRTLEYIRTHSIAVPPACPQVYAGPSEAYVAAWRAGIGGEALQRNTERLAKDVLAWGQRHRVGMSQAMLLVGHVHELRGRLDRAEQAWEEAISWAQRLDLPFLQASAELALGRLRGGQRTQAGRGHLLHAHQLFFRCGAAHHVRTARELLGRGIEDVLGVDHDGERSTEVARDARAM